MSPGPAITIFPNDQPAVMDTVGAAVVRMLTRKLAAAAPNDIHWDCVRRDNQDENRATIRMRMRRRGDYEGRA
jgi:hypothetical protein